MLHQIIPLHTRLVDEQERVKIRREAEAALVRARELLQRLNEEEALLRASLTAGYQDLQDTSLTRVVG